MKIPYRDLSIIDNEKKRKLLSSVEKVLTHGRIILGPEVNRLESKIASICNKKYAVAVSSGTDSLYLSLRSLDICAGDEVITTPLSWISTVNAIVLCGATPVFVDIGNDLNIDVQLINDALTAKTKAILPVHFTGKMCNMIRIMQCAIENNLFIIEDASQAFGSHMNNQKAGSFGDVNCFSLNPMKNLCAYGEAGVIVTDNKSIYEKLLSLRYSGTINKENCIYPSLNGRIDTIQAAMLLVELDYFVDKLKRIREIAHYYTERLQGIVLCPEEEGTYHSFYSYTIMTNRRKELMEYLNSKEIETKIQHPILMPYHSAYKNFFTSIKIPNAERLVEQILSIPNHEKLTQKEVKYIADSIENFFS